MRRPLVRFAIVLLAFVVLCGGGFLALRYLSHRTFGEPPTQQELESLMQQGQLIVDAVYRYREVEGRQPRSLDELVPDYLASVPPGNVARGRAPDDPAVRWEHYGSALQVWTGAYREHLQYFFEGHDPGWYINGDGTITPLRMAPADRAAGGP